MRILFALLLISCFICPAYSQNITIGDKADSAGIIVHKDARLDQLMKKQSQINEITTREARKNIKGFRLLVINTNDRNEAVAAKTKVYTYFPELKPYLGWQSPYYKLKVGNFKDRKEAEEYRKKLNVYFPKGVFIINDIIEVKLDKPDNEEEENE